MKQSTLFNTFLFGMILIFAALPIGCGLSDSTRERVLKLHEPEKAGMDAAKLKAALEYVMDKKSTKGIVIHRGDVMIAEAYANPEERERRHHSFSVGKSFTSALVGIAVSEGLLKLNDRVCRFYKEWDCADAKDPRSRITIRHLLTLTSGLDWQEDWSCPMTRARLAFRDSNAVYMDLALFKTPPDYVLARSSLHEPGKRFVYSTGDPALLSRIIEKAAGMTHLKYAREKLFEPLGIRDVEWQSDSRGHTRSYARLYLRTRDYAKLGRLYLREGRWNGKQIVPAAWVRESTRPGSKLSPWYGYLWHVNLPVKFKRPNSTIPKDAYMARGIFGQWIVVVPSQRLVITKNADDQCALDEPLFIEMVLAAIR